MEKVKHFKIWYNFHHFKNLVNLEGSKVRQNGHFKFLSTIKNIFSELNKKPGGSQSETKIYSMQIIIF